MKTRNYPLICIQVDELKTWLMEISLFGSYGVVYMMSAPTAQFIAVVKENLGFDVQSTVHTNHVGAAVIFFMLNFLLTLESHSHVEARLRDIIRKIPVKGSAFKEFIYSGLYAIGFGVIALVMTGHVGVVETGVWIIDWVITALVTVFIWMPFSGFLVIAATALWVKRS